MLIAKAMAIGGYNTNKAEEIVLTGSVSIMIFLRGRIVLITIDWIRERQLSDREYYAIYLGTAQSRDHVRSEAKCQVHQE